MPLAQWPIRWQCSRWVPQQTAMAAPRSPSSAKSAANASPLMRPFGSGPPSSSMLSTAARSAVGAGSGGRVRRREGISPGPGPVRATPKRLTSLSRTAGPPSRRVFCGTGRVPAGQREKPTTTLGAFAGGRGWAAALAGYGLGGHSAVRAGLDALPAVGRRGRMERGLALPSRRSRYARAATSRYAGKPGPWPAGRRGGGGPPITYTGRPLSSKRAQRTAGGMPQASEGSARACSVP
ncbi:hypothetical protein NX794_35465 [Streptomyces sp. LP11]|uniref:Uncharacterized protein n=1 Tax=Streptomyces pyxinicus TaxID=2970331 RepID=A0ABT2BDD3_9ACTN|nr:hypothetical protein [Streptomyces sp. LP11]MCS0606467.1 hypothetical protein [Streptomyces sp. LP11]